MKLLFSILDGDELLPHFVRHYLSLGVSEFLCVLYRPELMGRIKAEVPHGKVMIVQDVDFNGARDAAFHDALRVAYVRPDEWYAIADLDELIDLHGLSLPEGADLAQSDGADHVAGHFVDRITDDGTLPPRLASSVWSQFPWTADLTKNLVKGTTSKVVAARGRIPVRPGHHFADGRAWDVRAHVHHFKWWGPLVERSKARSLQYVQQKYPYANESNRLVEYLAAHGRFDVADPQLNARPWEGTWLWAQDNS